MWLYICALLVPAALSANEDRATYFAGAPKLRKGYRPEAKSVLPHGSGAAKNVVLQKELDMVMSFASKFDPEAEEMPTGAELPTAATPSADEIPIGTNASGAPIYASSAELPLDADLSASTELSSGKGGDPTSIEKMEKAVTDLITNTDKATPMGDSVKQIKDLIEKTMLPKVKNAHSANQKELNNLADAKACKLGKDSEEKAAGIELAKYLKASPLHKKCRRQEAALAIAAGDCKKNIGSSKTIKDLQCKLKEDYEKQWGRQAKVAQIIEKGGGESAKIYMKRLDDTFCHRTNSNSRELEFSKDSFNVHGFYGKFLDLEKKCSQATQKYNSLENGCKRKQRQYKAKKEACDIIQATMDGGACNRAILIKDSCESYAGCYNDKRVAFLTAKTAIKKAEVDRKAEWRALKRMTCLIDSFKDGKVNKKEVGDCKGKSHGTSHLNINYPKLEPPASCVVPDRYPATASYKRIEFAPLPALAKGNVDANECYGVLEISTRPMAGSPKSCKCSRVTLNGPYSAGALVKCTKCNDVFRSKDRNSCPEGTKIFSPRSRSDWQTVIASVPALRDPSWIVDVTRPSSGCGGCTKSGMNSKDRGQSSWGTSDGSPWWLRAMPYSEPNGDYDANCYLNLGNSISSADNVKFNDARCRAHSKSYYCQQKYLSTKPKSGSPRGCLCERVELTGRYSAGALLKCVGCLKVRRSTDKDSCPVGTKLFSPASREDWKTVLDSAGPLRSPHWIVDVTRPTNGCGGCKRKPMNFEIPEQSTWRTQDGSPWWLRSTRYSEPSGDYKANCYMNLWKNPNSPDDITFNDGNCGYHSNSYYCQPRAIKLR